MTGPQVLPDVRRWTGISALAVTVALVFESTWQIRAGLRPALADEAALADHFARHSSDVLIIVMTDTILMSALIVFLGCFRQLVTRARARLEWVADIAFGSGLVYAAITLGGDAMAGGAALDARSGNPDPVVIRALTEGHMLAFGAIGCVLTALVVAAAGYLTLRSGALPRWTAWVAFGAAALNLALVPTIFGGSDDASLFSVGGWATAFLGTFPWLIWVAIVGAVTVRGDRNQVASGEYLERTRG